MRTLLLHPLDVSPLSIRLSSRCSDAPTRGGGSTAYCFQCGRSSKGTPSAKSPMAAVVAPRASCMLTPTIIESQASGVRLLLRDMASPNSVSARAWCPVEQAQSTTLAPLYQVMHEPYAVRWNVDTKTT